MPVKWQLRRTDRRCRITRDTLVDEQMKCHYAITARCTRQGCGIIIGCCQRLAMPVKWQLSRTDRRCRITRYSLVDEQVKCHYAITSRCTRQSCGIIIGCRQRLAMPVKWQLGGTDRGCRITRYRLVDEQMKCHNAITSRCTRQSRGIIIGCRQ